MAAPTPPAEARVVDAGELAKLPGKWREHSKVAPAAAGRLMRDLADELEAALSAQPRFDETDDLTISSNCRNNALSAQPRPDDLRGRLQRQCSEWGAYWRAPDSHGVELTVEQATELLEDAVNVEVEIKSECQPVSAPVGVDVRSVIARAIGCGYSRGHQDTMEGKYTDVGYEDRVEYHGELADDLLSGDPDFAAIGMAQQPAAVPEKRAPVQRYHGKTIPWHVHGLAWEAYAKEYGKSQSAERIAERGGFGTGEMDTLLPGWREMAEGRQQPAAVDGAMSGKPAEPGIYAVWGFHYGHPTDHAIVEVIERDGELLTNLHETNSDRLRWGRLSECSDKFRWHRIAPSFTAALAQPQGEG